MKFKCFGPADPGSVSQLENCLAIEPETAIGALMADHHKGYSMPIGGVVGYKEHISPSGVGFDIGCGNLYAETPIPAKEADIPAIMSEISKVISFGMGRNNLEKIPDHPVFDEVDKLKDIIGHQSQAIRAKARAQLGTVGSGNHYVDLFENRTTGNLGVGVHFGSRGVGHGIAHGYMAVAAGLKFGDRFSEGGMDSPPLVLRIDQPSGQDYEAAMNIGLAFAYAGREWVVDRIVKGILKTQAIFTVHNNHNYASRENGYLMHRKGATPAYNGQQGFVGSTMGEDSVLVVGVNSNEATEALWSTVHGAGRAMSRTQAAGKTKRNKRWKCNNYRLCSYTAPLANHNIGQGGAAPKCPQCSNRMARYEDTNIVTPGLIDFEAVKQEMSDKGIYLIGAAADEAPGAYKRLSDVLKYHEGAISVTTYLKPLGVMMAGKDVKDDYKD